jgi:hypothetical protein
MSDEKPIVFELRVSAAELAEIVQGLEERREFYRGVIERLSPLQESPRLQEYKARRKLAGMLQVKCENLRHDQAVRLKAEREG